MTEVRTFVLLTLFISAMALGIGIFASDITGNYNTDVKNVDFISRSNETLDTVYEMKDRTETTAFDVVTFVFTAPLKAVKLVFDSLSTSTALFSDMASVIGIPTWFINLITGAFVIIITFIAISAYRKYRV